jgi:predicted enzyme related to lactoylglutathione lyase
MESVHSGKIDAMSKTGSIGWIDITIDNADEMRDFYEAVVGWKASAVDMGAYSDYTMNSPDDDSAQAGICHARGPNTGIPLAWIIYINVSDLDASMAACIARGGKVVGEVRHMGSQGRFCYIEDPAGAMAALFEAGARVEMSGD